MSWIPRAFRALPGPLPVRIVQALVIVAAFLVALHFFYEWLGNTFLDTGGTVG
jgi:hypothetical protein